MEGEKKDIKLTSKQAMFCKEYLIDLNGTQAAIRAGYSEHTATVIASENLLKPYIQDFIAKIAKDRNERVKVSADRVLKEYMKLAFSDLSDFFDENGNFKDIHDIDKEAIAALSGIDVEQLFEGRGDQREHIGSLAKIKTYDKLRALEALSKHVGLFAADNAQSKSEVIVNLPVSAEEIAQAKAGLDEEI